MKSTCFLALSLAVFVSALSVGTVVADDYEKTIELFKSSEAARPFFENSYGYAVFPTIGKGGMGIGGAYGRGQVYEKGQLRGASKLFKATIGLQLGGQAFSEIIFFEDQRAYKDFTGGSFEFDAQASAVAITAGVQAKAGTEGTTSSASAGPSTGKQASSVYRKGMVVFVHIKGGAMYEATIGGQKFSFEPL